MARPDAARTREPMAGMIPADGTTGTLYPKNHVAKAQLLRLPMRVYVQQLSTLTVLQPLLVVHVPPFLFWITQALFTHAACGHTTVTHRDQVAASRLRPGSLSSEHGHCQLVAGP